MSCNDNQISGISPQKVWPEILAFLSHVSGIPSIMMIVLCHVAPHREMFNLQKCKYMHACNLHTLHWSSPFMKCYAMMPVFVNWFLPTPQCLNHISSSNALMTRHWSEILHPNLPRLFTVHLLSWQQWIPQIQYACHVISNRYVRMSENMSENVQLTNFGNMGPFGVN